MTDKNGLKTGKWPIKSYQNMTADKIGQKWAKITGKMTGQKLSPKKAGQK